MTKQSIFIRAIITIKFKFNCFHYPLFTVSLGNVQGTCTRTNTKIDRDNRVTWTH